MKKVFDISDFIFDNNIEVSSIDHTNSSVNVKLKKCPFCGKEGCRIMIVPREGWDGYAFVCESHKDKGFKDLRYNFDKKLKIRDEIKQHIAEVKKNR